MSSNRSGSLVTRALRYRGGQAVLVWVLVLVAVATCAFGPLYERSVEKAQLRLTLDQAPVSGRGLSLQAHGLLGSLDPYLPSGALSGFFTAAVTSIEVPVGFAVHGRQLSGIVVSRTGQCAHLRLVGGRCPRAPFEVAASVAGARGLGWHVGDRVSVSAGPGVTVVGHRLTLVGLYAPVDSADDYWFGHAYSAGVQEIHNANASVETYSTDALFARVGFVQDLQQALPGPTSPTPVDLTQFTRTETDLALRVGRVGLDDMSGLRSGVDALIASNLAANPDVQVVTNISSVLDQVDRGRRQARTVIPAFVAELALLVLVTIGIVVVAAVDQRRPELALARLRGYSATGAAWQVNRDLLALVLAAVLPGLLLAWGAGSLAGRWWLSGRAGPDLRWPALAAAGAVLGAALLVIAVVSLRAAGTPVQELLRRVPPRWSRRGIGAAEAAVVAAALGGLIVVLSGDKNNALAVVTPGLLALLVGLVVSRLLGYLAQRVGRRACWRGRLGVGVAAVQVARRPGARRVVTLLCVAVALLVSAVDQWSVAARNRGVRADVQAGAATVLSVHTGGVSQLRAAVAAADPSGRYATAVIVQRPVNGEPLLAVDPARWASIATWGWPQDRPPVSLITKLSPALPPPVTVTGTSYRLRLVNIVVARTRGPGAGLSRAALSLRLNLRARDGRPLTVQSGPLPEAGPRAAPGNVTLSGALPCAGGCTLSQLGLVRSPSDTDMVDFSADITALDVGTPAAQRPVPLGDAADWAEATTETASSTGPSQLVAMSGGPNALRVTVANNSGAAAILQHLDIPIALPAVTAGPVAGATSQRGYLSPNGIDGLTVFVQPVGTTPLLPGAGGPAFLVDLDLATKIAVPGALADSAAQVWLASDTTGREHALVAALAAHGVTVTGRDSTAAHRKVLASAAPAWAMQLALVTAVLSALIAALVIAITAGASRRGRGYDLSALQLAGLARATLRRAGLLEQLITVAVAVLLGTVVGLIGAHLTFSAIPIFIADAVVPAVLRPTPWLIAAAAAIITLLILAATGVLTTVQLLRRVGPARLRESQT